VYEGMPLIFSRAVTTGAVSVLLAVGTAGATPLSCSEVPGVNDRPCPDFEATFGDSYAQLPLDVTVAGGLLVSAVASYDEDLRTDWVVVAVDRETGQEAWKVRHGTTPDQDFPLAVVASPDGETVYAAGDVGRATDEPRGDVEILALDTATGETRWTYRYGDPSGAADLAAAAALSGDGSTLFVGGTTPLPGGDQVGFVLAVDAATGQERFVRILDGPTDYDYLFDVASLPGGRVAALLHNDKGGGASYDALTVVLDPEGAEVWRNSYNDAGSNLFEYPRALAPSPDGATLYMTTESYDPPLASGLIQPYRVATVAYDAATGVRRWAHRTAGLAPAMPDRFMTPQGLTVAPDGTVVQIHQECKANLIECSWGTIALDPSGSVRWERAYDTPADPYELPLDLAAASDSSVVYVTGVSADAPGSFSLVHTDTVTGGSGVTGSTAVTGEAVTIAYNLATGEPAWTARYNSSPILNDYGFTRALALDPDGRMVYAAHTAYRGLRAAGSGAGNFADAVFIGYGTAAGAVNDIAGDANGLGPAGAHQDSRPASFGPADLRYAGIETTYEAIPVGEDGIHYEPTGLVIRLGTEAPPDVPDCPDPLSALCPVGPSAYRLATTIDGHSVRLDATVHREADGSLDAIAYLHVADGCSGGGGTCWRRFRASWEATVDLERKEVVVRFPFASLAPDEADLIGLGNTLGQPRGETILSYTTSTVQAAGQTLILERGVSADVTPRARDFLVGSDVPPDVPCTRGCP